MDTRAVDSVVIPDLHSDLFGVHERARRRNLATGNLGFMRRHGNLFRHQEISGNRHSKLCPIFRRVVDTGLAIGA